jgi:hypothetical protein
MNLYFWENLALNPNPKVIPFLEKKIEEGGYNDYNFCLNLAKSQNPYILHLLEPLLEKFHIYNEYEYFWDALCENPNPIVFPIIQKLIEKDKYNSEYCLVSLAMNTNPDVISLIEPLLMKKEEYYDCEEFWEVISKNPNIFEYEDIYFLK